MIITSELIQYHWIYIDSMKQNCGLNTCLSFLFFGIKIYSVYLLLEILFANLVSHFGHSFLYILEYFYMSYKLRKSFRLLKAKFFQLPVKRVNVPAQPLPVPWPLSQAKSQETRPKSICWAWRGSLPWSVSPFQSQEPPGQISGPVLL